MTIQDEVRAIAGTYLKKVKTTGSDNILATCPFHRKSDGSEEQNPSFSMSLSKGVYHCFACGVSGNLYTFLRDLGMPRPIVQNNFSSLIDALAKSTPKRFNALNPEAEELEPMDEEILGLFDACPVQMVDEFGFSEELLQSMDIGFDDVHKRVTFPLRDWKGNLLGISGRDVTGYGPRFKVYTDEYAAFGFPVRKAPRKGIVLWNAHRVYPQAYFARDAKVILVEGFKACLRVMQAGHANCVAALTKTVSNQQKWILESMGATVYIFFDNDAPGREGLLQTADKLTRSLKVMIVEYEGAQPSDLDVDYLSQCIETAQNYYVWATNKET